ncbi:MAG: UvrD-helicase domain-containing protein [Akkermansiaceae bacterium]|nr:UvrD-helicase domain-containing protein [Akkermansiaceae bacterium]
MYRWCLQVLVKRLKYLLSRGVDPGAILAITFTRKASAEMYERLTRQVERDQAKSLTIGTFHAVCGSALRRCSLHCAAGFNGAPARACHTARAWLPMHANCTPSVSCALYASCR